MDELYENGYRKEAVDFLRNLRQSVQVSTAGACRTVRITASLRAGILPFIRGRRSI
jgi:hypothetical protein